MRRQWLLMIVPALMLAAVILSSLGLGFSREVRRDPPLLDRAAVQRAMIPGVSTLKDAVALLGDPRGVGHGVVDEKGVFQHQPGDKTGPAAWCTWESSRHYVRGSGWFRTERTDSRIIEMFFGPPDFTLRKLVDRDVEGEWIGRTYSSR